MCPDHLDLTRRPDDARMDDHVDVACTFVGRPGNFEITVAAALTGMDWCNSYDKTGNHETNQRLHSVPLPGSTSHLCRRAAAQRIVRRARIVRIVRDVSDYYCAQSHAAPNPERSELSERLVQRERDRHGHDDLHRHPVQQRRRETPLT